MVAKVRRIAQTKKVGHLGTLDPLATGVLPLLVGRATRLAQFFVRSDKVYEGTIRFGFATDTYDAEGTPSAAPVEVEVDCAAIEQQLAGMIGKRQQVPPPVSAKKIGGVPAYKLARRNVEVRLEPAAVEIFSTRLLRCEGAEIDVRVHCSAGTYMRSIAHDLGIQFGCGAHLKRLRRLASGAFRIEEARTLDQLSALAAEARITDALIPAAELLPDFPAETVDATTAAFIRQGRDFRVSPFRSAGGAAYVKAVTPDGELVAIGQAKLPHLYHPLLVL